MKLIPIYISAIITWAMVMCADIATAEELIQRSFEIKDVTAVQATGDGIIELTIGEEERLQVTAPASVMAKLRVDAKGSTLRIKQKDGGFWHWVTGQHSEVKSDKHRVMYKLTVKELSSLVLNRNMHVKVLSSIQADTFDIKLAGAAQVDINELRLQTALDLKCSGASHIDIKALHAQTISAHAAGASTLMLAGETQKQDIHLSGASNYYAKNLLANSVEINASGASNADLWVSDKLGGKLSGASNVSYIGKTVSTIDTSGASSVSRLDDKS